MKVFGICMVRNEEDVIGVTLRHHLSLGLDHVLVADNGSSDGTARVLHALSRGGRVSFRHEGGGFQPDRLGTALAREAFSRGADWVVPFDADEFWHVPGNDLPGLLARCPGAAMEVNLVSFIQHRDQGTSKPEALLHATHRPAVPFGPIEACESMVEARQIAYVEILYPTKWACRAGAAVEFAAGYHAVTGIDGPRARSEDAVILHVPLRSRAALEAKADQGRRVVEAGFQGGDFWHSRRFHRIRGEGGLDAEWAANSHQGGSLDVYGARHEVVFDPSLRDLLLPLVRRPVWRQCWDGLKGLAARTLHDRGVAT